MTRIKTIARWLMRIGHSRGFGVQSPSAYNFIRYVVNEHYPYYAYDDLKHSVKGISRDTRKLCRLYFRIANFAQADTCIDFAPATDAYASYISRGCRRTKIVAVPYNATADEAMQTIEEAKGTALIRMTPCCHFAQAVEKAIVQASDDTILIIEDIHQDTEAKHVWHWLTEDNRAGVTFDLYYCGIVFFDKIRPKQNYIVNF